MADLLRKLKGKRLLTGQQDQIILLVIKDFEITTHMQVTKQTLWRKSRVEENLYLDNLVIEGYSKRQQKWGQFEDPYPVLLSNLVAMRNKAIAAEEAYESIGSFFPNEEEDDDDA